MTYRFHAYHLLEWRRKQTRDTPMKVTFQSPPQQQRHRSRNRTLANGCDHSERLRTRKERRANTAAIPSDSQVKREPFATHSGNNFAHRTHQKHIDLRRTFFDKSLGLVPIVFTWRARRELRHGPALDIAPARSPGNKLDSVSSRPPDFLSSQERSPLAEHVNRNTRTPISKHLDVSVIVDLMWSPSKGNMCGQSS